MTNQRSSIIISVFSTTPGIGKTMTAINLTAGLAREGYSVCLVDLDLQFGDVMNYLKLDSDYTLATAQRILQKDPYSFDVKNCLVDYNYASMNFSVLPPPKYLSDAYLIDVHATENIIKQLDYFDFVIPTGLFRFCDTRFKFGIQFIKSCDAGYKHNYKLCRCHRFFACPEKF